MAPQAERPETKTSALLRARPAQLHRADEVLGVQHGARARDFPGARDSKANPKCGQGKAPITVGSTNAELRELEGVGVVASAYEPIEPKFNQFRAPVAGHYKLRFNALFGLGRAGTEQQMVHPESGRHFARPARRAGDDQCRDSAAAPAQAGRFRCHAGAGRA